MKDWQDMLNADVLTLGMAADEARRSVLGDVVTYVRVHDLSQAAGAGAADGDSFAVPDAAAELRTYAAPETFERAVAHLQAMKRVAGGRRVVAFSWEELANRRWDDRAHLLELVAAGWTDVAELPADRIEDLDAAVDAMSGAGVMPQRVTVAGPLGADRAGLIRRVQQTFSVFPSLRRFSPLPRKAPADKPTTGYDDVRMVALARLALPERSIEVDWQLYGPKLAQVALTFGADHLDAVAAVDDTSLGRRRTVVEDVERNIKAAGFEPKEYRPPAQA